MRKIFFARAVLSPPWDQLSVSARSADSSPHRSNEASL
jgi:hypothetical protein